MKKTTMIIGLFSSLLFLVGVIMKFQHWPGAGVCLTLGGGIFAICYAPLLFMDKSKVATTGYQKLVNMMTLFTIILIMASFLFKVQHWPGAGIGIYLGHALLIILIPVLIFHAVKETEAVKKMNFYNEAFFLILLTAFSFFVWAMTTSRESLDYFAKLDERINNTDTLVIKANDNIYAAIKRAGTENPGYCANQFDQAGKARVLGNEMNKFIDDLKKFMLMQTEEFKDTVVLDTLHLCYLKSKANHDIPEKVLFAGDNEDPSKGKARELKLKLEAYKSALTELLPEKEREGLDLGLNTDSIKTEWGYKQWEFYTLETNTLVSAIAVLSEIQLSVRIAEAKVIGILSSDIIETQLYEIYKLKNPRDSVKVKAKVKK